MSEDSPKAFSEPPDPAQSFGVDHEAAAQVHAEAVKLTKQEFDMGNVIVPTPAAMAELSGKPSAGNEIVSTTVIAQARENVAADNVSNNPSPPNA